MVIMHVLYVDHRHDTRPIAIIEMNNLTFWCRLLPTSDRAHHGFSKH